MGELDDFIADVVLKGGQPVWAKLFDSLGEFFNKRFGPDWKQRNQFFEEFEKSLTEQQWSWISSIEFVMFDLPWQEQYP